MADSALELSSRRILVASLALCLLAACSGGGGEGGGVHVAITASAPEIVADGTTSVTLHVTGGSRAPFHVISTRGTLSGSVFSSTPFEVVLAACDSRVNAACAGDAVVTVADASLQSAAVTVKLRGMERCEDGQDNDGDGDVDCADSDCPDGSTCSSGGLSCSQGACATCSGNGAPPEASESSCDDHRDNDCDGKVDCFDPDCTGDVCGTGTVVAGHEVMGVCRTVGPLPSCVCTPATGGETGAACSNGLDDDCDGLVDCQDTSCQPQGNAPGQVCDQLGHTCTPPAATGGVSACTACSGNGGTPQAVETSCFDGADNDCNGVADCQDPNCAAQGLRCSASGKVCNATTFTCVCPGGAAETNCHDGVDDDCDGLIDCADPDCSSVAASCGANGLTCTKAGACACTGNGGVAQATEAACGDGADNDCDGAVDCADVSCRPTVAGTFGAACNGTTGAAYGMKCNLAGQCVCSRGETQEATCGDGVDNDCDGLVDCADPDCQPAGSGILGQACSATGYTCGTSGTCNVCSGNGGVAQATESSCGDSFDNDCDGKVDCDDANCLNQLCQAGSTSARCTASGGSVVCLDTALQRSLTVTTGASRLAANGTATTTVKATLKTLVGGVLTPTSGQTITFAITSGPGTLLQASAITSTAGEATVTFRAAATAGTATITATYDPGSGSPTLATAAVDQPQLGNVKLTYAQWQIMGARYSGFQETNQLTFQVLDTSNAPYPPGLEVQFSHQALGGSYVGASEVCVAGPPRVCTATAVTDAEGKASVLLHSGSVANVVSVTAVATGGGATGQADATQLAVVGAKPSGLRIALNCTPTMVPGFTDHDCITSAYGGVDSDVTCTVTLADRFNNVLGVATVATFQSEAGSAGPPATTPVYDPKQAPTSQTGLGRATDFIAVTGFELPWDVMPFSGESEYSEAYDDGAGCGTRIHNPRDGLSTVLVRVNGEEGFVDGSNGLPANGAYDVGEYFLDQGEPFVDADDSGVQNGDEPYVDVNSNGRWDGPNGQWDQNTVIWAETRVLYTGFPAAHVVQDGQPPTAYLGGSRFYDPSDLVTPPLPNPAPAIPPFPTRPVSFQVSPEVTAAPARPAVHDSLLVYFGDSNFNPPTYRTTYALATSSDVNASWYLGQSPKIVDSLGATFSKLFCTSATPTNPATQCSSSCRSSPCFLVPRVTSFAYGTFGVVDIAPTSKVAPGQTVSATATFNSIAQQITVGGASVAQ